MPTIHDMVARITEINVSVLSNSELLNFFISISSLAVAVLSFLVSIIALIYTGYQFVLKKGTKFYGVYSVASSSWSRQRYVSEIIIENKKDKVVAISFIYLRINRNIYLELVDYESSPRIVNPFETIKIQLIEGVSGYISSTFKVDLDALLADSKIHKSLMIATPQGLFKAKRYKKFWNVYVESLRNNFVIPVKPVKKYYKEKDYSDNLQFVVMENSKGEALVEHFLYRGRSYLINGISINVDEFDSARELEDFLSAEEKSVSRRYKVKQVDYTYRDFNTYEQVEINHGGIIKTHIAGRIYTKIQEWTIRKENKRMRSKR